MPIQNKVRMPSGIRHTIDHMKFLQSLDGMTIEQAKEKEMEYLNNLKIKSEYADKMIIQSETKIEE